MSHCPVRPRRLVHILLWSAVPLAIPAVHRRQRRWPWKISLALAGVDLLQRFDVVELLVSRAGACAVALWAGLGGRSVAKPLAARRRDCPGPIDDPGIILQLEYRSATMLVGFFVLLGIAMLPVPRGWHRITALRGLRLPCMSDVTLTRSFTPCWWRGTKGLPSLLPWQWVWLTGLPPPAPWPAPSGGFGFAGLMVSHVDRRPGCQMRPDFSAALGRERYRLWAKRHAASISAPTAAAKTAVPGPVERYWASAANVVGGIMPQR